MVEKSIDCMLIQKEKIIYFEKQLSDFFAKAGREYLPWRKEGITAYEVWVSEIMLQQTQVSRVIEYYQKFLIRFPTVESLAKTNWETFLPYYQGLGYYARGKNMLLTAQIVAKKYKGIFPSSEIDLDTLPGIGPYTAAAIASFAYDQNTLAWDTNLRRVVGRFFFGTRKSENVFRLEGRFRIRAMILNAALMDLGSSLCTSRPKCAACPLMQKCKYWLEKGKQEQVKNYQPKNNQTIDWERAPTYIILHALHRQYFSENMLRYQPFVLPHGFTDRSGIKRWFAQRYDLTVSVRPPEKDVERGIIFVNVQILIGQFPFAIYSRESFRDFLLHPEMVP